MSHKRKILLLAICLGWIISMPVFAATAELNEEAGTLPTSKFYFLKTWGEWTRMNILTIDKEKKAKLSLRFAEKRLAEMEALKEKGALDEKKATKLTGNYERLMDKVQGRIEEKKQKGDDDTSLSDNVIGKMSKHQEVLDRVEEKVPDNAKGAIKKAKTMSIRGEEKAMERILEAKKENKIDDKYTADKITQMVQELRKHLAQREEKLNKKESEGKDVSQAREELVKARTSLEKAQTHLANKEFTQAFEVLKQGKSYLSGMESLIEKLPAKEKIKEEIEKESSNGIKEKIKVEIEREGVKEKIKKEVETNNVKEKIEEKIKSEIKVER